MKKTLCLLLTAVLLCGLAACAAAPAAPAPAPAAPTEQTGDRTEPEEAIPEEPAVPCCTVTIRCDVLLEHMDELNPDKSELVPEDGCLLPLTAVQLQDGDTVFDVLQRVTRTEKLQMEFNATPMYDSKYIEGICNLYELDCGPLSGWTYSVNGEFPGIGLNQQPVAEGDEVQILYTCDLGADVGNVYLGD